MRCYVRLDVTFTISNVSFESAVLMGTEFFDTGFVRNVNHGTVQLFLTVDLMVVL